jgi:fused signal recognition particle receptor
MGIFKKIKSGLSRTRGAIVGRLDGVFGSASSIDDELYDELEEVLVSSDVGVATSEYLMEKLREKVKKTGSKDPGEARGLLMEVMKEELGSDEPLKLETKPSVILVIGVNGVGKTTTIGKLAASFVADGKKVVLAAADTFRAAAIEQLEIWAKRAGAEIISQKEGADPAAVIFDALTAAKARGADIVICDTAGRLHNKKNLMEELAKISRVIDRELPGASRENLLVLDAATGQNGVNQAREFGKTAGLTGIILTKLDGTARGGIVFAISHELGIPVKYIGVGEQIDDLQPFSADEFVRALFDKSES